jgi:Tn3 transposase DDE domain
MSRTLTVTAPTPCRLAKCSEYGKEGDITGADGDEQEISMLSLHLLQSALVHLNTIFLQRVLDGGDFTLAGEDRRALSRVHSRGPVRTPGPPGCSRGCQAGVAVGSQGCSARAVWMASRTVRPWLRAEVR